MEKWICPCCGCLSLDQPAGQYDVCPICFWEDAPYERANPKQAKGANGVSLEEARGNYIRMGACTEQMKPFVRAPMKEELSLDEADFAQGQHREREKAMNYSVVFSSKTGNTQMLAQALQALQPQSCTYFGPAAPEGVMADVICVGFWADKGACDEAIATFLQGLRGKQVFLFGTAGFGGDQAYFDNLLSRVTPHLDASNTVVGSYMCQGKMPQSVRARYEGMLAQNPEKMQEMIANFDAALAHPNAEDMQALEAAAKAAIFAQ